MTTPHRQTDLQGAQPVAEMHLAAGIAHAHCTETHRARALHGDALSCRACTHLAAQLGKMLQHNFVTAV